MAELERSLAALVSALACQKRRDHKARGTEVETILEGMDQKLVSIAFGGSFDNLVVGSMGMQAGAN